MVGTILAVVAVLLGFSLLVLGTNLLVKLFVDQETTAGVEFAEGVDTGSVILVYIMIALSFVVIMGIIIGHATTI